MAITIFNKILRLREKFKGYWGTLVSAPKKRKKFYTGEHSWKARCLHYDKLYDEHSLAKSCILSIAGRALENGFFLEAAGDYPRAEEAMEKCEELNRQVRMVPLLYDTIVSWGKHGSCFWEKTWEPVFDVRMIPSQEDVEPAEIDEIGNITVWRQNLSFASTEKPTWNADEIVHFAWNVTSQSYPYGTSLFVGTETEFETLEQLETDIKEHMHKTAFPQTAIGVGDKDTPATEEEVAGVKSKIKGWEPGQIDVTNFPLSQITISGGQAIANLNDVLTFLKDNATDSLMISPISKLYNSTYASSKEMQEMEKARLIAPMQRILAATIEDEIYTPYLISKDYSARVCPRVKWEAPDADKVEDAEYWLMQIQGGLPAEYAWEQQGFDMEKIVKLKQEQMRREAEQAQLMKVQGQQQQFPISPKQGVRQKVNPEEKGE